MVKRLKPYSRRRCPDKGVVVILSKPRKVRLYDIE